MEKIKKVYRLICLSVFLFFVLPDILYCQDIGALRVPSMFQEEDEKTRYENAGTFEEVDPNEFPPQ